MAGNLTLDECYRNTCYLKQFIKADTPLFEGCIEPLSKPLVVTQDIHGEHGLGDVIPDFKPLPSSQHSVDFIIEQCLDSKNPPVTLCMLGPLTNLAAALNQSPEITQQIKQVVIMGGALDKPGNTTPFAEFNFFTDPHAAEAVFNTDLDIVLCPLDLTHQAAIPQQWVRTLVDSGTAIGIEAAEILSTNSYGGALHDPCVIAWLLKPELFKSKRCNVRIETVGEKEGKSLVEWAPNGKVTALMKLNHSALFQLLSKRLTE